LTNDHLFSLQKIYYKNDIHNHRCIKLKN